MVARRHPDLLHHPRSRKKFLRLPHILGGFRTQTHSPRQQPGHRPVAVAQSALPPARPSMVASAFRTAATFIVLSFLAASSLSPARGPVGQSAQPKSHRMPVARKFSYACDGGLTVNVTI